MTLAIRRKIVSFKVTVDGTLEKIVLAKNGNGKINAKIKRKKLIVWEEMGYNTFAHLVKRNYEDKYPGKKINIKYLGKTI